jgi:electron transport complex protein RnfB
VSLKAASAEAIDAVLPQTQCGQCGYRGCRPYADAIATAAAPINQCPPGGGEVIAELAELLGRPVLPLNATHGHAADPAIASIDEAACIGCTLCIAACPVDAIVGARRLMHTVITAECTGCALCLPPCPVNCIALLPTGASRNRQAQRALAPRLRGRYQTRLRRLETRERQQRDKAAAGAAARKKSAVARALARAQERLAGRKP